MPDQPKPDVPFEVGDTDLNLAAENERLRPVPPKDPLTGKFVKTDPEPITPPATPTHPVYLVAPAKDAGLTDADLAGMTTEQLGQWVYLFQKQQQQLSQRASAEHAIEKAMGRPVPAPAPAVEEDPFGVDEDGKPLSEQLHPGLTKFLKNLSKENKELKAQLAEQGQREQQRQQRAVTRMIDDAFELLGPTYEKHFGKGPVTGLRADAREMKRRMAVLTETGLDLNNTTPAELRKALQKAADDLYGAPEAPAPVQDPYGAAKNGKTVTPEEWNAAALARPTQRRGADEPAGEEKARRNLAAKMAGQGAEIVDSEPGDREILDGLVK